jgi:hypothetical protein
MREITVNLVTAWPGCENEEIIEVEDSITRQELSDLLYDMAIENAQPDFEIISDEVMEDD